MRDGGSFLGAVFVSRIEGTDVAQVTLERKLNLLLSKNPNEDNVRPALKKLFHGRVCLRLFTSVE